MEYSLIKILLFQLQSDYAFTLKSENELLNQDILTLEEELTKSKEERDKVEFLIIFIYSWHNLLLTDYLPLSLAEAL